MGLTLDKLMLRIALKVDTETKKTDEWTEGEGENEGDENKGDGQRNKVHNWCTNQVVACKSRGPALLEL